MSAQLRTHSRLINVSCRQMPDALTRNRILGDISDIYVAIIEAKLIWSTTVLDLRHLVITVKNVKS